MGIAQLEPARVAQWIRAFACGAKGRVFESRRGRHLFLKPFTDNMVKGLHFERLAREAIVIKSNAVERYK